MKKIILFQFIMLPLIIVLSTKLSTAQFQSLFGKNQTSWNIKHQQLFGEYCDSLAVIGDTIINENVWKKIYCYTPILNPDLQTVKGFIREDTITGKAWYYSSVDTNINLIMDLSLNMSDSFYIDNLGGDYLVDSIYYFSGKKHVRFNLTISYTSNNEKFTMIEGTGTNIGIRYTDNQWPGINPYLMCHYKDSQLVFINKDSIYGIKCNTSIIAVSEQEKESNINIFPNPTKDYLYIENYVNSNITAIEILDIQGKIKISINNIFDDPNNPINIDISKLKSGVYIIKMISRDFNYHLKFIKF
ncbi:MAG TPA: T9SS type A sorting domain-containing protein [Bacteroidales bacterium]|nr:T9SS type A sorting domain-containing protein [Bacteroidales bacterium]HNZ43238.1 T9SS type A sorting domain-containing protein [Bacteroidales bacterium]HPB25950.1 T9SS type A sorting domain-containing protein [Bacteroidales bacterium]HPI30762.1 T9SS type A sorting domain-containing protein [Bacteroidales bacterium]HQN16726.1 T9SS type A sorting domain-containing protein [Bacteroidales bacterium]